MILACVGREERRASVLLEGYARASRKEKRGRGEAAVCAPRWLQMLFSHAGREGTAVTFFYGRLVVVAVLLGVCATQFRTILVVPLYPIHLLVEYLLLKRQSDRRVLAFDRDYPTLLTSLGSSVRGGMDVLEAMCTVKELFEKESEIRKELTLFAARLDGGESKEKALRSFAKTIQHPDISLFVSALLLNQQNGCSVSDALQRLVRVVRQRQSFRRKVKAAVAMQKMSAIGIGLAFIVILLFQLSLNFAQVSRAFHDPLGRTMYALGAVAMVCGSVWMGGLIRRHLSCW